MIGNGKYIYRFGNRAIDGDGSMRSELGGKGAGLAEMTLLSIPVPPGFTISTIVCRYYLEHKSLPPGFEQELAAAIRWLEGAVGRALGDPANPLLTSVRSGAVVSMPGMMDTILNVGLTRENLQGLAVQSGSLLVREHRSRKTLRQCHHGQGWAGQPDAAQPEIHPCQFQAEEGRVGAGAADPLVQSQRRPADLR